MKNKVKERMKKKHKHTYVTEKQQQDCHDLIKLFNEKQKIILHIKLTHIPITSI